MSDQPTPAATDEKTEAVASAIDHRIAAAVAPAAATPAAATPVHPAREENVSPFELTVEEAEALFASQHRPNPRGASMGSTAVMDENDMDRLLQTLGEDAESNQYAWLPSWAKSNPKAARQAPRYTADDVYAAADEVHGGEDDQLASIGQIVRDLEVSVATIDDTTVSMRSRLADLDEEVRTAQQQLTNIEEDTALIKAQNVAMVEEMRELRHNFTVMRSHLASLVRLMTGEPARGPIPSPAPAAAPAALAAAPAALPGGPGPASESTK